MNIQIEPTVITATFPFDKAVIASVKSIGMRWNPVKKHWYMTNNVQNRGLLERLGTPQPPQVVTNYNDYIPSPVLMQHQKDGVEIAKRKNRWLFGWDTGVGKTLAAIEIYKMKKLKTLIVCPLSIIEHAWFEDLRKFAPEVKAVNLWMLWRGYSKNGGKSTYKKAISSHNLAIINFEGLKSQRELIEAASFKMIIIDESSKIKSPKAQITKDMIKYCENMESVYLMSGTPAPNTPLEFFPQIKIIDPTVFGKSFWGFRNKYFHEAGFKWIMHRDMKDEFEQKLTSCMSVVNKADVLDLPDTTWNIRDVSLSPDELKAYSTMTKQLIAEIKGHQISASNAAVKIGKLRQVTSGFLLDEDSKVHKFGDSKIRALQELLEEIGRHQVIIWSQFHEEARQIKKLLGDKAEVINGTIPQGEREISISRFKDKKLQYLIAHPKSMGHGHTLTTCSYAVYFSMDYSYESWKQSADRIHRFGQKNQCTYYSLIVPGTIDQVIYRALQRKGDVQNEVLNYIKDYKVKGEKNNGEGVSSTDR